MIKLHNVHGVELAINGELVERVEGGTETRVTLVNGTTYIVEETLDGVVQLQREDRAHVQAMAVQMLSGGEAAADDGADALRGSREAALRLVVPAAGEDGERR